MPWTQVACLYHQLMRNANQFNSHMFRSYALRRIRHAFSEGRNLQDAEKISSAIEEAKSTLPMIRRQALLSQLYPDQNKS